VKLWNVADGKVQRELIHPKLTGDPKPSHPGYVYGVRFSKDGKYLYSVGRAPGKGAVQVWSAADGKLVSADELDVGPIFGLALAPDGKSLAVATGPRGRPGSQEAQESPLAYILKLPDLP
jgi:WD40 repeat protein